MNRNIILLSIVVSLALVMPGVTDAYAQEARDITVNLRNDFQVTIVFADFVSGVPSSTVEFRNPEGRDSFLISGGEQRGNSNYFIADFNTPITFTQFRDTTETITIEYDIRGVTVTSYRADLIINLNPASGQPSATVERPTHVPFLPSQGALQEGVTLKFSDYINTERPRSDYVMSLAFANDNDKAEFPVRGGTDPDDGDLSFLITSNTGDVVFGPFDTSFTRTIPLTITVGTDNTHFIRPASGRVLSNNEIFVVNIVITDERLILERSVDVSLPDNLQLNYKDFIPTDRSFSDWDVEITYDDRTDYDNKLRITGGTDSDDGDATFRFTSETITFARQNPGNGIFNGSVPFSMKITTTSAPHFVGTDTTISRSDTIDVTLFAPTPTTPDIPVTIIPGDRGAIDLSGITDELDTFDELTITFDTTESNITVDTIVSNILDHGNSFLPDNLNSIDGPIFQIIDPTASDPTDPPQTTIFFRPSFGAPTGEAFTVPYTVVNSIGAMSSGDIIITFDRPLNTGIAADAMVILPNPIAANIPVTATQNAISTINFTTSVSDLKDDLDTLIISIVTDDSRVTGPTGVTSPASFFTFNGTDTIDNTNSLTVTTAAQRNNQAEDVNPDDPGVRTVRFTPHHSTPVGEYTFPYTVTDSDGFSNIGDAHIAITVSPRVNANPTVAAITEPTSGIDNVDINFYDVISDDIDDDSELTVRFSFDNIEHRSIFVPSSSSATVDSTDSNLYTLTVDPVTFEFIAAPSVTTAIGLTYTVTDSNDGTSDTSTVTITYTVDLSSTNMAPSANPITIDPLVIIGFPGLNDFTVDFRGNVTDVDDDDNTLRILFAPPSHLIINSEDATVNTNSGNYTLVNNLVRFTTTESTVSGVTVFNYTVVDSEGLSATNTVTFTAARSSCNFENIDADSLNFNRIENAEPSDDVSFMVRNIGNISLDLNLSAGNWTNPNDVASTEKNPVMYANSTAYSLLSEQVYKNKMQFTISGVDTIDAIEPSIRQSIYLQLNATLIDDSFVGEIRQEIDTTSFCLIPETPPAGN